MGDILASNMFFFLSTSYFHPQSLGTYHLQQGEDVKQGES